MTTYKKAGVDKEEGYKTVSKIKNTLKDTFSKNVLMDVGSFAAFYELHENYKKPVLVSGTDGVGSKIMIALETEIYDSIGQDCYAMCANDILCHGAKPLFFLDYLACGKLNSNIASNIINGLAKTCKEYNTSLIGGETAELGGLLKRDDYDLAGFCVGIVEKANIISGKKITSNDSIIGLASSGIHSNGFSLVRKIFKDYYATFEKKPLYKTLLTPTKVYVKTIHEILKFYHIKGLAHITGGGLVENVARIIPDSLCAEIDTSTINIPNIFKAIEQKGQVLEKEMWGTFNMGIGMVIIVSPSKTKPILAKLEKLGEEAYLIGKIVKNSKTKIILK